MSLLSIATYGWFTDRSYDLLSISTYGLFEGEDPVIPGPENILLLSAIIDMTLDLKSSKAKTIITSQSSRDDDVPLVVVFKNELTFMSTSVERGHHR